MGTIRKKNKDKTFSLFENSCILTIKVARGMKKLFIMNAAIMYNGTLNHHQLNADLSFAVIRASANISSCFK